MKRGASVGRLVALGLGVASGLHVQRDPGASNASCANEHYSLPRYGEPGRPQFHFTPKKFWMNDPNGLVQYQGEYHLFFQHNPFGAQWGHMTWGHAVSNDLLHWQQLQLAILPDKHGDIWSGSVVVDWRNTSGLQRGPKPPMVALYTAWPYQLGPNEQRLAYSTDVGRTWSKLVKPVVPALNGSRSARDPKVEWHEASQQWIMALWLHESVYGLLTSRDLRLWVPLQNIDLPNSWECPDFFEMPVEGAAANTMRFVFIGAGGAYLVGAFDGKSFTPSGPVRHLEYGDAYASQTYSNEPQGRRVQLAWMGRGTCGAQLNWHGPFTGQMTIPMELGLFALPDGSHLLRRRPARELAALRVQPALLEFRGTAAGPGWQGTGLVAASGAGLELRLRLRKQGLEPATLELGFQDRTLLLEFSGAPAVQEFLHSGFKQHTETLMSAGWVSAQGQRMPLQADDSSALEITVFVDRLSIEVFDSVGGASMAVCAGLPCKQGQWLHNVTTTVLSGRAQIEALEVYELAPTLPH